MQVKCNYCNGKQERGEMYCDTGKQRKYYHHPCWPLELERRIDVEKEKKQWKDLIAFIQEIHNLHEIPRTFYAFLQDIRNGTIRFQGPVNQQYKQGVGYDILLESYRLSANGIKWAQQNRDFNGNVFTELKYGLAIVKNNIGQAREAHRAKIKIQSSPVGVPVEDRETNYKPRQHQQNITAFLKE